MSRFVGFGGLELPRGEVFRPFLVSVRHHCFRDLYDSKKKKMTVRVYFQGRFGVPLPMGEVPFRFLDQFL